jgi:hypothetical protein
MKKRGGGERIAERITINVTAAISPNESKWGGGGLHKLLSIPIRWTKPFTPWHTPFYCYHNSDISRPMEQNLF